MEWTHPDPKLSTEQPATTRVGACKPSLLLIFNLMSFRPALSCRQGVLYSFGILITDIAPEKLVGFVEGCSGDLSAFCDV